MVKSYNDDDVKNDDDYDYSDGFVVRDDEEIEYDAAPPPKKKRRILSDSLPIMTPPVPPPPPFLQPQNAKKIPKFHPPLTLKTKKKPDVADEDPALHDEEKKADEADDEEDEDDEDDEDDDDDEEDDEDDDEDYEPDEKDDIFLILKNSLGFGQFGKNNHIDESYISSIKNADEKNEVSNFVNIVKQTSNEKGTGESFHSMAPEMRSKCLESARQIANKISITSQNNSKIIQLLCSNIPENAKIEIYKHLNFVNDSTEKNKFEIYFNHVMSFPWGRETPNIFNFISEPKKFLQDAKLTLDECVYGHEEGKHSIIKYLSNLIGNNNSQGRVLGFVGPPGIGKTSLVREGISKILSRPFASMSLGGYTDAASLEGYSYTYEGSRPGRIVEIFKTAGCINPIIYLDEVDKIGKEEVVNMLIHLLDPSQNKTFQDRYFGNIDIDLSKVMFILSYNDSFSFSHILRDRITEIRLESFTDSDKISIAENYLVPRICKELNLDLISLHSDVIQKLILEYTSEGGVRKLREKIFDLFSEIKFQQNTNLIAAKPNRRITLKNFEKFIKFKIPISIEKIHTEPRVGLVNGLYCCAELGVGGIIPIHVSWIPSEDLLQLQLTGNLGKIMKESSYVSKIVAWNYIQHKNQKKFLKKWKSGLKEGIHIHCSESSVEKEGPSAGLALTVAIISLFLNTTIKETVGMTGEIDLCGNVMEIGGLREKLFGAKRAGIKLVLFPQNNLKHFDNIVKKYPDLITENFKAIPVKTLEDAIPHIFN